jgi:hypothetical protein
MNIFHKVQRCQNRFFRKRKYSIGAKNYEINAMGRLIDIHKDLAQAELWQQGDDTASLDLLHLVDLARLGIEPCKEYCSSREVCGEHRCVCVRDAFPTPEHYELYLLLRSEYKRLITLGMATTAAVFDGLDKKL